MPDHLHALLSFAKDQWMSRIVGDWKHFQTRKHGIIWQEGYFDHRLRADERGDQLSAKMDYIRQNPVAANLCVKADDWPCIIERAKGGSSSPFVRLRTDSSRGELDAKIWRRSRINKHRPGSCRADPPLTPPRVVLLEVYRGRC